MLQRKLKTPFPLAHIHLHRVTLKSLSVYIKFDPQQSTSLIFNLEARHSHQKLGSSFCFRTENIVLSNVLFHMQLQSTSDAYEEFQQKKKKMTQNAACQLQLDISVRLPTLFLDTTNSIIGGSTFLGSSKGHAQVCTVWQKDLSQPRIRLRLEETQPRQHSYSSQSIIQCSNYVSALHPGPENNFCSSLYRCVDLPPHLELA